MFKKILLSLCLLLMPMTSMADPTSTPTLSPTSTWTPVPNSPASPYIQQLGTSTVNLLKRQAIYTYDASVGDYGKEGPHVLKPVGGQGVPYGAWVTEVYMGPIERCFDNGGGTARMQLGTRETSNLFTTGADLSTNVMNTCGTSDGTGFSCMFCGGSWKVMGTDNNTGARLLNDVPVILTVIAGSLKVGKITFVIEYIVMPIAVIQQQTLTPSPTPEG